MPRAGAPQKGSAPQHCDSLFVAFRGKIYRSFYETNTVNFRYLKKKLIAIPLVQITVPIEQIVTSTN